MYRLVFLVGCVQQCLNVAVAEGILEFALAILFVLLMPLEEPKEYDCNDKQSDFPDFDK